jgi:Cys/Met metabolism PLP-dependent enzyme
LGLGNASNLASETLRLSAIARKESNELTSVIQQGAYPGSFQFVPFDLAGIEGIAGLVKTVMTTGSNGSPMGIKGGRRTAVKFYDALKRITRLVNLGDAKSPARDPASTTHRQMSAEEQRSAGFVPEMVRLSIGIEHIDDTIAD